MNDHHESMKRVFKGIKGAARGFRKEKLASRLTQSTDDTALSPVTLEPGDPDPLPMTSQSGEGSGVEEGETSEVETTDAVEEANKKRIRELVRRA